LYPCLPCSRRPQSLRIDLDQVEDEIERAKTLALTVHQDHKAALERLSATYHRHERALDLAGIPAELDDRAVEALIERVLQEV
jgi:hypothetical protein